MIYNNFARSSQFVAISWCKELPSIDWRQTIQRTNDRNGVFLFRGCCDCDGAMGWRIMTRVVEKSISSDLLSSRRLRPHPPLRLSFEMGKRNEYLWKKYVTMVYWLFMLAIRDTMRLLLLLYSCRCLIVFPIPCCLRCLRCLCFRRSRIVSLLKLNGEFTVIAKLSFINNVEPSLRFVCFVQTRYVGTSHKSVFSNNEKWK